MKVKELIEKLNKMDQNLSIICFTEDEDLLEEEQMVRPLDIVDISTGQAELSRNDSGEAQIKFTRENPASSYVFIHITSDV